LSRRACRFTTSPARDLTKLLIASEQYPLIGQLSTTKEEMATFAHPAYTLPFRNTNHLVYRDNWNIQLTKTGFTNAAGHCLVMRTVINGAGGAGGDGCLRQIYPLCRRQPPAYLD
jgi:D-alanyl-D-alanine carboxypeptidase